MPQNPSAAAAASALVIVAVTALADKPSSPQRDVVGAAPTAGCGAGCRPPPGRGFRVGDIAAPDRVHRITKPGSYGLSDPPKGDAYAILDGAIIRIDAASGKIRSVLRPAPRILD